MGNPLYFHFWRIGFGEVDSWADPVFYAFPNGETWAHVCFGIFWREYP